MNVCQATSASLQHGEVLALWRGGGWKGLEHRPLDDGGERWLFLWPGSQWQQRRGAQKSKAAAMTESRSSKKCTRRQEVHDQMVKSTFFFFVGHPKKYPHFHESSGWSVGQVGPWLPGPLLAQIFAVRRLLQGDPSEFCLMGFETEAPQEPSPGWSALGPGWVRNFQAQQTVVCHFAPKKGCIPYTPYTYVYLRNCHLKRDNDH